MDDRFFEAKIIVNFTIGVNKLIKKFSANEFKVLFGYFSAF
jgi:hypothetical protein